MGIHEKFFLIEDDYDDAKSALDELTNAGHELVRHAENFQDAIDFIPSLEKSGITVVILDGNLNSYQEDCADGRAIARIIRAKAPYVKIVAHSRSSQIIANYGDIYVGKREASGKLAEAVTAILRNQK